MFTEETFKQALPKQMRKNVSPTVMHQINASITDPDIRDHMLDNILSFTSVLSEGKFKMESYLNGVKYISFKTMGDTNVQAWTKTFPDKYARLVANNATDKDISAHVAMYNGTKIISLLLEQTLRPIHIMNAHHLQNAINTQAAIMADPKVSPKVRSDAANSLLTHLKQPETKKIELEATVKDSSALSDLKTITAQFAAQQRDLIASKVSTAKEIAHQSIIIEGELEDEL